MSYRFLRQNSQFIAATLTSGYALTLLTYKLNRGSWLREKQYEFKNRINIYEGLTKSEEEKAQKFLYRLEGSEKNVDFFRSRTFDYLGFGYNSSRQGAQVGLPVSYFANSKEEIATFLPKEIGYNTLFGYDIKLDEISDPQIKDMFLESLLLSEDAKLYGLARAVQETNHLMKSNIDIIIDTFCMMSYYVYCYSRNRQLKLQLNQRRAMYLRAGVFFLTVAVASRFLVYKFLDYTFDKKACRMGLDCSEGSLEYYNKLILRNKILRNLILDGHRFIDQDGNYLKQTIYVPFTNFYFYVNYIGLKLTERKEICKKELDIFIDQLQAKSTDKKNEKK